MKKASRRLEPLEVPLGVVRALRGRSRSGMDVLVAPMPGFATVHAVVAARFGSRDVGLPDGRALPPGTAHFLEHAMFQKADGDLFDRFEARGASANAWTTVGATAYHFSSPGHLEVHLADLLDGIRTLEVEPDDVVRERAIIAQEIASYDDDPGWRGAFALLQALYRRHPVRLDIAGTPASIAAIDLDVLRAAHAAYYAPGNCVLVVAGDVDPGHVMAVADRHAPGTPRGRVRRPAWKDEPPAVRRRDVRLPMDVVRPHVLLGAKEAPGRTRAARLRRQVEGALVVDVLFGHAGRLEALLHREGWIDDAFSAAWEGEDDYAHLVVSAEVDDADAWRRRLERALEEAGRRGFEDAEVERSRRRARGGFLRAFNAPESVAQWLLAHALDDVDLGARWAFLEASTPRGLERRLHAMLAAPRSWAFVLPG